MNDRPVSLVNLASLLIQILNAHCLVAEDVFV